jgi:hypothetical protein
VLDWRIMAGRRRIGRRITWVLPVAAAAAAAALALGLVLSLSSVFAGSGVTTVPQTSAPLHSTMGVDDGSMAGAGSLENSIVLVIVHNVAPGPVRVLGTSTRTIGRLHVDGSSLETVPDNNPGEGVTRTPFQSPPGAVWSAITRTHHPLVRPGAEEVLAVRVHIPPGKAGGATLSASLRYRTGGKLYRTTYPMSFMFCAGTFEGGGLCDQLHAQMLTEIGIDVG